MKYTRLFIYSSVCFCFVLVPHVLTLIYLTFETASAANSPNSYRQWLGLGHLKVLLLRSRSLVSLPKESRNFSSSSVRRLAPDHPSHYSTAMKTRNHKSLLDLRKMDHSSYVHLPTQVRVWLSIIIPKAKRACISTTLWERPVDNDSSLWIAY